MSSKKAEKKPFWIDDEEWERKYPQMPQANIAENVAAGVPELHEVERGEIIGAYTFKDGFLVYHFYKKDRKELYDSAFEEMAKVQSNDQQDVIRTQNAIAHKANVELENCPWWDNFEEELDKAFGEVFKYQEHKTTFYPEVDSWSVILPAPSGLVKPGKQQLEKPFSMLALRLGTN